MTIGKIYKYEDSKLSFIYNSFIYNLIFTNFIKIKNDIYTYK